MIARVSNAARLNFAVASNPRKFSTINAYAGAVVIWTFTVTIYHLGVPANALLAAKAVLVLVVILLYSDYTRRFINRLTTKRRVAKHETTN